MSLDRSLKSANALIRHRNVLTRAERLEKLAEEGKWDEKKPPFGLPKVAHRKVEAAKPVKLETEGDAAAPGATAAGAAPAAGAKGAAPAKGAAAPAAKGAAPAAGAKAAAAPAAKKK